MTTLDIILIIALPAVVVGGAIIGLEAFLARRRRRTGPPSETPLFDRAAYPEQSDAEHLFTVGDETDVHQAIQLVNAPPPADVSAALARYYRRA